MTSVLSIMMLAVARSCFRLQTLFRKFITKKSRQNVWFSLHKSETHVIGLFTFVSHHFRSLLADFHFN